MSLTRESKPSKTQQVQDAQIASRDLVRYILAPLKDDGTIEQVDDGPWPHKSQTWKTSTPGVARQQIGAMLRKNIGDLPAFVVLEAHVADGAGGIKVVKGKDIPPVFDHASGRPMAMPLPTPEWLEARKEFVKARDEIAQRGKAAVQQSVQQIAAETVAVAEKAKPSRNAPAT